MNYPVWDIPLCGSGLVVAIIATFHVLISHLAIGGGAFLFVAEVWSDRQAAGGRIREWLHKYATYFLVYTTVFGAVSGVGIWFAIQLANPEATSLLIHQFVFVWATEWVMFLAELTTLYLYYYGWRTNSQRMQILLAGAYFVIAWFSLFLINGILTFMLTPGMWNLENTDIVAGFFNPGFFPSLFIRTLAMFLLGGLFGIIVGTTIANDISLKERVIAHSVRWVLPAAVLIPLLVWWYATTLPDNAVALARGGVVGVGGGSLAAMARHVCLAVISVALIVCGTLLMALRPRSATTAGAIALFLMAQLGVVGAEFFREMARKPYVIYGVLYSNGLWVDRAVDMTYMRSSYVDATKWAPPLQAGTPEHGAWVFRLQCANCHTRDGYRSIAKRTKTWTTDFAKDWLTRMDETRVMPPFQGDEIDRQALAAYLVSLHEEGEASGPLVAKSLRPAPVADSPGPTPVHAGENTR